MHDWFRFVRVEFKNVQKTMLPIISDIANPISPLNTLAEHVRLNA